MRKASLYFLFLGVALIPGFMLYQSCSDISMWLVGLAIGWAFSQGAIYNGIASEHKDIVVQKDVLLGFVRAFWADDPILATAVWKKAYPNVVPPWHAAAQEGEKSS